MVTADDLKEIPIFACLEPQEQTRLAGKAADVRLQEAEWLIREGDQPWFFVLLEGRLELLKDVQGRQQVLTEYKIGEFFGEVPILLGGPAFVSIRALSAARVARFEPQQLMELIKDSGESSALILQTMTNRLMTVQQFAKEAPGVRVLLLGTRYDVDCRDIRSFLSANRIAYEWIDHVREPERIPVCMEGKPVGPSVVIDRKLWMGSPTVRQVAEALGLQTKPGREQYDVVVIGGGPAGLAAAVYGASEGLCVLLVERNAAGGQAGTSSRIENYLGFPNGITGDELSDRALRQATRFGAELVLTREVKNIEVLSDGQRNQGYCVELDGGDRVKSKTVILATGVDWRRLEAEGVERLQGRGVLYGASRTEAPTVIGKDVFIVGGGNSAGQAAMFFSSYANTVTVVVRGAGLELSMSQYLIEQMAQKKNIRVEPWTQVTEVDGQDCLEWITTKTKDGEVQTRKADALFVLIGADANTAWLPTGLQRDERGYVCTGRDVMDLPDWKGTRPPFLLETSLPGFFCAGDVRHDSIKRVSSGVGEGSMAIAFVHQYLAVLARG